MEVAYKIQEQSEVKTEKLVLHTLAYFDLFDYPLLEKEIKNFCGERITDEQINIALDALGTSGCLFHHDKFWSLRDDPALATNRINGNARASKLFPKALRIGAFLHSFPYVRAVAISGSLSKNFADEKGDIDFFIVTKANRLWIARTLMHLFKKLTYLFGQQHSFCMNYYLDDTVLEIEPKNIYTATEIKTLVPVAGSKTLPVFFERNSWVNDWLPNMLTPQVAQPDRSPALKRFVEWVFDNGWGGAIDNYLLRVTTKRWIRKEGRGKKNVKGRVMNLLTSRHFAKSNPDFYQERLINVYENKLGELQLRWPQYFA